jgi:hypothetical protein
MTMKRGLISAVILCLVATISFAVGAQTKSHAAATMVESKSNTVGIYIESVQRQIDIRELRKNYPGESAQRLNPAALKADAIVGWYDKGNNYHEQKMQNNLKSLGGIRVLPEMLRGVALKGEAHQ